MPDPRFLPVPATRRFQYPRHHRHTLTARVLSPQVVALLPDDAKGFERKSCFENIDLHREVTQRITYLGPSHARLRPDNHAREAKFVVEMRQSASRRRVLSPQDGPAGVLHLRTASESTS